MYHVWCNVFIQTISTMNLCFQTQLDFLNEEAVDDAWVVSSYLSDADFLLSPSKNMIATNFGTENLQHLVAASVAVRGVLFGNNHPSPSSQTDNSKILLMLQWRQAVGSTQEREE
ncbi:unnamed protein product [Cuscuta europaea]|uniref:Uncharacterized protein n=1 Tax=Cuscuta europaea TaxID=41803 RepID=A0A9P0VN90_CUSEU|nr:unnamed protein product [Cuscuta europaea]